MSELAKALAALGCPLEKCGGMAAQLDKRARQLSAQKNRTYEQALAHLLDLMSHGWAAQQKHAEFQVDSDSSYMIKPWKKVGSTPVGNFRIFTIRSDQKISPRTGREHDFYVIDSVNWVNVIALTPERNVVMVEQYRHGSDTVELEIPGGMMDATETSPVATGVRELREETGYEGENARVLDQVWANPAIMSNLCYTIVVENCRHVHECSWDHGEDLVTRLIPLTDIPKLVAEEKIKHPLVIAGLYHFDLLQRGLKRV